MKCVISTPLSSPKVIAKNEDWFQIGSSCLPLVGQTDQHINVEIVIFCMLIWYVLTSKIHMNFSIFSTTQTQGQSYVKN